MFDLTLFVLALVLVLGFAALMFALTLGIYFLFLFLGIPFNGVIIYSIVTIVTFILIVFGLREAFREIPYR